MCLNFIFHLRNFVIKTLYASIDADAGLYAHLFKKKKNYIAAHDINLIRNKHDQRNENDFDPSTELN
jgi:hypothetical protein